mmetsp:Transcript_33234/g.95382  ORF Transcript_33234/g.95382 Transcript_33234/m.95382 type:complete len:210 (+) Transcript_33234:913-1542(+)
MTPCFQSVARMSPTFFHSTRFPGATHSANSCFGAGFATAVFQSNDWWLRVSSSTMKQMVSVSKPVLTKLSPCRPITLETKSAGISMKARSSSSSASDTFAHPCDELQTRRAYLAARATLCLCSAEIVKNENEMFNVAPEMSAMRLLADCTGWPLKGDVMFGVLVRASSSFHSSDTLPPSTTWAHLSVTTSSSSMGEKPASAGMASGIGA